jgi:hypothetical protein
LDGRKGDAFQKIHMNRHADFRSFRQECYRVIKGKTVGDETYAVAYSVIHACDNGIGYSFGKTEIVRMKKKVHLMCIQVVMETGIPMTV